MIEIEIVKTVLLMSVPGYAICMAGLVYMHWFDKPDEVEVIKEVVKTDTVYKEGKEPAKVVYIDRYQQSYNQLMDSKREDILRSTGGQQLLGYQQLAAAQQDQSIGIGATQGLMGNLLGY